MSRKDKWIHGAIPALLIHCSVGSVYAWSLFVNPISQYTGYSQSVIQFAFSLAIFFLGMSAAFGGSIVEKNVSKSSLISLVCFCSGLLITGLSIYAKSLMGIYIGYGCIMGVGLGVGYLTPVKTLMMWFKENKGLATGIAITGFGFASTIASPLITFLMNHFDLSIVFVIMGLIYTIPMCLAMYLIKKPYKDDQSNSNFQYTSMLKDKNFVKVWLVMFINITCGLALISTAAPIMTTYGISAAIITVVVAVMGITNGFGRLGIATLSDLTNNKKIVYITFLALSTMLCLIANWFKYPTMLMITLIVIPAFYGAGFSCLPALLSDMYGMKNISKIHGLCLTSWSMAGLCGNQLSSLVYKTTGSYDALYIFLGVMYVIAMGIMASVKIRGIKNGA